MYIVRQGNQQLKTVAVSYRLLSLNRNLNFLIDLQPYSELAKGGATAKNSILVNYGQRKFVRLCLPAFGRLLTICIGESLARSLPQ